MEAVVLRRAGGDHAARADVDQLAQERGSMRRPHANAQTTGASSGVQAPVEADCAASTDGGRPRRRSSRRAPRSASRCPRRSTPAAPRSPSHPRRVAARGRRDGRARRRRAGGSPAAASAYQHGEAGRCLARVAMAELPARGVLERRKQGAVDLATPRRQRHAVRRCGGGDGPAHPAQGERRRERAALLDRIPAGRPHVRASIAWRAILTRAKF